MLMSEIINGSWDSPRVTMQRFIGRLIKTYHGGKILEYRVTGVTKMPLQYQTVYHESMTLYYRKKYGIELKYPDWPCFETRGTQVIPAELASSEDFSAF
jgi:hypothetical protein